MKKLSVILIAIMLVFSSSLFTGCGENGATVLKVCNCEDYIAEDICERFEEYMAEKGKNVKVEYSTYGTNENLYNDLKIADGYAYDLVCPSEYMIEKMAKEGMLAEIPDGGASVYDEYASPYIKNIFNEKITWTDKDGNIKKLSDYAVAYMWGTLGLVYNPETVSAEDMKSWLSLWKPEYKNKSTIKDSVRDSYFIGVAYAYKDELKNGGLTNERLTEIFNDTSEETVKKVQAGLNSLKNNIFGFEVDSGKNDMVTGKISINFAWSGDAVYAMDEAEPTEENPDGLELCYSVPEEGSNVWFDGWCIPRHAEQKELAVEFINFISMPENAVRNMEYIGYTSAIAGDADFSIDYYEYDSAGEPIESTKETVEYTGISDWMQQTYALTEEETEDNVHAVDLSYFFGKETIVYTDVIGRQFSAQYPPQDVIDRCVFMHYFDEKTNTRINEMWENVKGESFSVWVIVLIIVGMALFVGLVLLIKYNGKIFKGRTRRAKKGYRVVSVENL